MRAAGGADPQVIAAFEDGWLLTDAAWVRCFGDAAKLVERVKPDEEGRVVEVDLRSYEDMEELPASVGKLQMLQKLRPPCPWCHGIKHMDVIFVQSGMGACNSCAANIVSRLNFAGRMPNASQHIVSFEPRYYNLLKSGSGGSEALESILPMTDQQKEKAMAARAGARKRAGTKA